MIEGGRGAPSFSFPSWDPRRSTKAIRGEVSQPLRSPVLIPPHEEENAQNPRDPPPPCPARPRVCPGWAGRRGGGFIKRLRDMKLPVTVERGFGNVMVSRDVPECVSRFERRVNRGALRVRSDGAGPSHDAFPQCVSQFNCIGMRELAKGRAIAAWRMFDSRRTLRYGCGRLEGAYLLSRQRDLRRDLHSTKQSQLVHGMRGASCGSVGGDYGG
jgi:hypothetical protein